MRSDWDPTFGEGPDTQKRYPDITREEWAYLHQVARLGLAYVAEPEKEVEAVNALLRKIEQRLGSDPPGHEGPQAPSSR
jgi:hypothetical protein